MALSMGLLGASLEVIPVENFSVIQSVTLSSAQAEITFTDLTSYANEFEHLHIRGLTRNSNNSSLSSVGFRLNGDSGNNYSAHTIELVNTGFAAPNAVPTNAIYHYTGGNQNEAGTFTPALIDLPNAFKTDRNKAIKIKSGFIYPSNWRIIQIAGGGWYNTSAISSVTLFANGTTFMAGTRFAIYGLRKS